MLLKRSKYQQRMRKWRWRDLYPITNFLNFKNYLIVLAILLSACGGQVARIPENPYVAPSLAPKIQISPTETLETSEPNETISCKDNLKFVDDVTVPDGTRFAPRASIEKVWLVRNEGTCNWDTGYTLRLISGPEMGAEVEKALFPARNGSEVEIRLLFFAPGAPGRYVSKWQAFDPAGEPFGDLIFIDIVVDVSLIPPAENTPTPEETAEDDEG